MNLTDAEVRKFAKLDLEARGARVELIEAVSTYNKVVAEALGKLAAVAKRHNDALDGLSGFLEDTGQARIGKGDRETCDGRSWVETSVRLERFHYAVPTKSFITAEKVVAPGPERYIDALPTVRPGSLP